MPWTPELLDYLAGLSVTLSENQQTASNRYADLLTQRGKSLNLLSAGDLARIYDRHLCDSLVGVPVIDWTGKRVVDIGTGAGLPGLPLAVMLPDTQFTLLDRTRKRISFLQYVIRDLDLPNAEAVWGSAEDLSHDDTRGGSYDAAVFRAVTGTEPALKLASPLLKPEGSVLIWQSREQWDNDTTPEEWRAEWVELPAPDGSLRGIRICTRMK